MMLELLWEHVVRRITLVGDVPVGVGGRPSLSIKGEPILAVETELTAAAG